MNPASKAVGALLALGLVVATAVGGWYVVREIGPGFLPDRCEATVGDLTVELTPEQAENAALIAAIGVRRGLPARAVSIALATAYQESGLRNLTTGDRDSLGLFQQRPSQGWGTEQQLQDPVYATNAFYDALVEVAGYSLTRREPPPEEIADLVAALHGPHHSATASKDASA
nr:hypothetical protein [uncultured Rhodococcus sp.]